MTTAKLEISGLKVLTAEDVENLMTSALEGGSNYWYEIRGKSCERIYAATEDMDGAAFVDRLLIAVQRGTKVIVFDVEDQDSKLGELTPESWSKAEQLMMEKHRRHLGDILSGNDDACTGDVFFQLALMGEVVYG